MKAQFPEASEFDQNLTEIADLTQTGPAPSGGDGPKNAPYKSSINAFEGLIHDRCLYDRCLCRGICNLELDRKRPPGLSAG